MGPLRAHGPLKAMYYIAMLMTHLKAMLRSSHHASYPPLLLVHVASTCSAVSCMLQAAASSLLAARLYD